MSNETNCLTMDHLAELLARAENREMTLKAENIRLRRDLIDPPADVQELVIQKLKLVSAAALIPLQEENARLLREQRDTERYISREHVSSWARIEAELGSYDPWKPKSLCDRTVERLKEYHQLIFAVERKHKGETRHQTAMRYIREAETISNQTAVASSAVANQGEQKS